MSELTAERLAELRRVAEEVKDVTFEFAGGDGNVVGVNGIPFAFYCGSCGYALSTNQAVMADTPVATHVVAFDPPTVLALLDEIERLTTRVAQLEESHDWWRTEANRRLRERAAILDILGREEMGAETKVEGVRMILNKTKGGDGP